MDSCPAVFWQEALSANTRWYLSDERRSQETAGREDVDKTLENCSSVSAAGGGSERKA